MSSSSGSGLPVNVHTGLNGSDDTSDSEDSPGPSERKASFAPPGPIGLSLRTVHRSLAVARTIADTAAAGTVGTTHLPESLGGRERVAVDVEPVEPRRGARFRAMA